jgi:putative effector of murein hydrolase
MNRHLRDLTLMGEFVELWVYLSATPLFGLTATLGVYVVFAAIYERSGQLPWLNPVLWSIVALGAGLWLSGVSYPQYFSGAQFIHFLLGPAVVALALPLWQRRAELKRQFSRVLLAGLLGGMASALSAYALALMLGLPSDLAWSLIPKSVTAPVAMGLAESIGGIPELAAIFAVLSGLIGALLGRAIFTAMRLGQNATDWRRRGFALGTVSHGIGAARALQVNADAGAYAGLALAVQVVLASVWIPLFFFWLS